MSEDQLQRTDEGHAGTPAVATRGLWGHAALRIGTVLLLVVFAVAALLLWLRARRYVSTDDAFIDAHIIYAAPRVPRQVIAVYVTDNQLVHTDQALLELDPADYRARLEEAQSQVAEARAALDESKARVDASAAGYRLSLANLVSAHAEAVKAQSDLRRYLDLRASAPRAVSQLQIDQALAAERSASAQEDAARQQTRTAATQIETAHAALAASAATLRSAESAAHIAALDLGYTRITAPATGHVTQRSVAVGDYVSVGGQLMAIVPLELYVTANFKETDLAQIRRDEPVAVHVDACPAARVRGHVESVQRGAGEAFALLPAENATGNYVKVVQRVPVKIALDRVPGDCILGPGMSVEPTVSVR